MKLVRADHSGEIEAALRQHPGVREAAVFAWESGDDNHRLVAYVVPKDEHLDRILPGSSDESRRIEKWRKTYELTQLGKQSGALPPDFNIAGWNSSYTRSAIPENEMREWVHLTVQEILSLAPSEVLEVGCGTGLLLLRLARQCKRYVGVDNAGAVLKTLQREMDELGGDWTHVKLIERAADDLDGFASDSFDTLILNSVVQYFPSLSYLLKVLEKAIRVVKPGGRIFLGDLKSLPLNGALSASIELFQAAPETTVEELRERARKRLRLDEQLALSPALFLVLRRRWPRISRVELQPRRGRFDNEMSRYRFNATLHLGSAPAARIEPEWGSWSEKLGLGQISAMLKGQGLEWLALKQVPNRRVEKDVFAFAELQKRNSRETVEAFKHQIEGFKHTGIDPQDLWSLSEQTGYDMRISWAASRADGSYDVVLRKQGSQNAFNSSVISWPEPSLVSEDLDIYANHPMKGIPREKLLQQLRQHCQHFPQTMRPSDLILLDTLPVSADGRIDCEALPSPATVSL